MQDKFIFSESIPTKIENMEATFSSMEDLYEVLFSDKPVSVLVWNSNKTKIIDASLIFELQEFFEIISQKPGISEVIIRHKDAEGQKYLLDKDLSSGFRKGFVMLHEKTAINFKCEYIGSEKLQIFDAKEEYHNFQKQKPVELIPNIHNFRGNKAFPSIKSSRIAKPKNNLIPSKVIVTTVEENDYLGCLMQWRFTEENQHFKDPGQTLMDGAIQGEYYLDLSKYRVWAYYFARRNGIVKDLVFPFNIIFPLVATYLSDSHVKKYEGHLSLTEIENTIVYWHKDKEELIEKHFANPINILKFATINPLIIRELYLPDLMLGSHKTIELLRVLSQGQSLTKLDLSGNNLTHVCGTKLGVFIGNYSKFNYINLAFNKLGPLGCLNFTLQLDKTDIIEYLDLSANRIGKYKDQDSLDIMNFLFEKLFGDGMAYGIENLSLQSNQINGAMLDKILDIESIDTYKSWSLCSVDFSNNLITRSSNLLKFMKSANTVQVLFINDNPLEPDFQVDLINSSVVGGYVKVLECKVPSKETSTAAKIGIVLDSSQDTAGSLAYLKCTLQDALIPENFKAGMKLNSELLVTEINSLIDNKNGKNTNVIIRNQDKLTDLLKLMLVYTHRKSDFANWIINEVIDKVPEIGELL